MGRADGAGFARVTGFAGCERVGGRRIVAARQAWAHIMWLRLLARRGHVLAAAIARRRRWSTGSRRLLLYGGMSTLYTLAAKADARQEIKKSRFVATAVAVENEDAAKEFLAQHADQTANHNCWAWRIGQTYRFSDDGEPSGTAGKPILQAIDGQSLDRVAVVVTRWFGGVLLGSGGLIRAYGGTAALCLRAAERIPVVDTIPATMTCLFGDLALLQARLGALPGVQMHSPAFNDTGASWALSVPRDDADRLARLVNDLTSGRADLRFEA